VASLGASHDSITADCLELTELAATITARGVAVVALFAQATLKGAVTTDLDLACGATAIDRNDATVVARRAGIRAAVAANVLQVARSITAVTRVGVSVVALFSETALSRPVTTDFGAARRAAAVAADQVSVVTGFAALGVSIAADGFDEAQVATAIAAERV